MSMRIFVTGASGYLGSAIAARLARAGYQVRGLTRSPARGQVLAAVGVTPVVGDLTVPEGFLAELKNSDAVVHAAFDGSAAARTDQRALEAIRAAAQDGRVRRVLYTSGVWVHGDTAGTIADESSPLDAPEIVRWRPAHEEVAFDLAAHEVAVVAFRPAMVYGECRGVLGGWFQEARERGTVTYPGDGEQHWGMVHRDDVAEAYYLGLEEASGGTRYLLADDSRHTVREIAEAVARVSGAQARSLAAPEALRIMGSFGAALLMDQQFSAGKARRELGWVPRHASFVADVEAIHREWLSGRQAAVA